MFAPYTPDSGQTGLARFDHVQSCESEEGRESVEEFWQNAVNGRSEGLMVKVGVDILAVSASCQLNGQHHSFSIAARWLKMSERKGSQGANRCLRLTSPVSNRTVESVCIRLIIRFRKLDKRTSAWLKLKKDYVTGLGDSLDLVPIGAWHGNGRKAQWWSPILLAVWDPDSGKLVAVCKCMSGKHLFLVSPSVCNAAELKQQSTGFSDAFYKARRPHVS